MKFPIKTVAVVLTILLVTSCSYGSNQSKELLVFAAASLTWPLEEVKARFEKETGIKLIISYGASQSLAQQIASGAPADVFLSAGEFPVTFLKERGIISESPTLFLRNSLVVGISDTRNLSLKSIEELSSPTIQRIAIADPILAPAGRYAQEALETLGLWEKLLPKIVFAADVRTALAYVESNNADVAFVYATDADASKSVVSMDMVPNTSHSPIIYPLVILTEDSTDPLPSIFAQYLKGPDAQQIFSKFGFDSP